MSGNRVAGNLDYVEEHWADAIARFRYVAASDEDRVLARDTASSCTGWRSCAAGIARPEFVTRTPGEGWPQPLLLYMRGEYTESRTVVPINEGDSEDNTQPNTSTDERLCEALFYVGEEYWARGKPDVARALFRRAGEHQGALLPRARSGAGRNRKAAANMDTPARAGRVRANLAAAAHHVFVGGELLDAHGPARMKAVGGDADLRAHAELAAIGELRRGVVQHDGAVDALEESLARWPRSR